MGFVGNWSFQMAQGDRRVMKTPTRKLEKNLLLGKRGQIREATEFGGKESFECMRPSVGENPILQWLLGVSITPARLVALWLFLVSRRKTSPQKNTAFKVDRESRPRGHYI